RCCSSGADASAVLRCGPPNSPGLADGIADSTQLPHPVKIAVSTGGRSDFSDRGWDALPTCGSPRSAVVPVAASIPGAVRHQQCEANPGGQSLRFDGAMSRVSHE